MGAIFPSGIAIALDKELIVAGDVVGGTVAVLIGKPRKHRAGVRSRGGNRGRFAGSTADLRSAVEGCDLKGSCTPRIMISP